MLENELLLGENVAYLVRTLKLCNDVELAKALGMSAANVGMLINGKNKGMTPVNLVKLARYFGLTAETMVTVDLRADREYNQLLATRTFGITEPPPSYFGNSDAWERLRGLWDQIGKAAITGRLTAQSIDYLERTLQMLLSQHEPAASDQAQRQLSDR